MKQGIIIGVIGGDEARGKITTILAGHGYHNIKMIDIKPDSSFADVELIMHGINTHDRIVIVNPNNHENLLGLNQFINENEELLKTHELITYEKLEYEDYLEEEKPPNEGARRAVKSHTIGDNYLRMREKKKLKNRKKRRTK